MAQFGSDNHAPIHPEILAAINSENIGMSPSYGMDTSSTRLTQFLQSELGTQCQVFSVFTGTAANVLCFSHLKSFESIAVCDGSHIWLDECGAPEKFLGCKLWPLPNHNGLLALNDLQKLITRRGDQHYSQLKAVSLTLPSELGTLYTKSDLQQLSHFCKEHSLFLHIDGTRLYNALHSYGWTLPEFVKLVQPDAISLGGSKNGFLIGELILCFNNELAQVLKYTRKQMGQLPSKSRFIAAPFLHYLSSGLAERIAADSVKAAQKLSQAISAIDKSLIAHPVEANAVFVKLSLKIVSQMKKRGHFFYVWDERQELCRLMTHWGTTDSDIQEFATDLKEALSQ